MIEEMGKVVAVNGRRAWVETTRQSACDSCSAKSGCGHSVLAKLGQKSYHMEANCKFEVDVGEHVVVGVPEDVVVRSSFLAYLLPLLVMLGLSLLADHYTSNEAVTALFACLGLASGFVVLRWHFKRHEHDPRYQPVVLRRSASIDGIIECP